MLGSCCPCARKLLSLVVCRRIRLAAGRSGAPGRAGSAGLVVGPVTGCVPRRDQQCRWPVERDPTLRFPDPARKGDHGSGRHRSHVRKRRSPESLGARVRAEASLLLTRIPRPRGVETRGGRAADPGRAGPCPCLLPPPPPVLDHFCSFQVDSSSTHHTHTHTGPWHMGTHTHVGVERILKSGWSCLGLGWLGGGRGLLVELLPFPDRRARAALE